MHAASTTFRLLENPYYSHALGQSQPGRASSQNRIIYGDNLPILQALCLEFTNSIKCIYLDPPYNTGNTFPHYDDGRAHEQWLTDLKPRLTLLWSLLREDGLLVIQIDDNEFARLYLLLADMWGEHNLKTICVKMAEPTGVKMAHVRAHGSIPKLKEYLLLAGKSGVRGLHPERIGKDTWDPEYRWVVSQTSADAICTLRAIIENPARTSEDLRQADTICHHFSLEPLDAVCQRETHACLSSEWLQANAWRIVRTCSTSTTAKQRADRKRTALDPEAGAFTIETARRKLYVMTSRYNPDRAQPRIRILFAADYLSVHPGDFWADIKTTGLGDEGQVTFTKGKKPEALLKRIIGMATQPGDWVLDAFAGSGTTGAVAHKMGRRWIMIEHGQHCHTHLLPRLRAVIDGSDQTGISKNLQWQGGGGFRYFQLATPQLAQRS